MSRCRDCGARGNHLGGCPAVARTELRSRVQAIVGASSPPAAGSRRNGHSRTPRLAQKVLGFRRWRLNGYRLLPLTPLTPLTPLMPAYWRIGPNTAKCLRAHSDSAAPPGQGHRAPHHACECGLHALHDPPQGVPGATVSGAVLAWGRIETHANGFRAEYAEPVVLGYDREQPSQLIRTLCSIAGEFCLPVVEHPELAAAAALLGRPIPPELRPAYAPSPAASSPTICE